MSSFGDEDDDPQLALGRERDASSTTTNTSTTTTPTDETEMEDEADDTVDSRVSDVASSTVNESPQSTTGELPPVITMKKKKKPRTRTQSESAAWSRTSFKMSPLPPTALGSFPATNGVLSKESSAMHTTRSSDGMLNHMTQGILDSLDWSDVVGSDGDLNHDGPRMRSHSRPDSRANQIGNLSRERCINMWLQHGQISERASEILEDAKLSLHGKEKHLYQSSLRRLSEAQDPMLNSLGEKMQALSAKSEQSFMDQFTEDFNTPTCTPEELQHSDGVEDDSDESPAKPVHVEKEDLINSFRPESATLYHEAVKWEGVLSRRSEWLRRLERHYYVLEGKFLRRFSSKEAYLATRDEPLLRDTERLRRASSAIAPAVSHLYVLAGVKDSSTRTNGFTFITEDKKTLQLAAPTAVEKVVWMRLGLEAIVALPNLPVAPLDMEEFYAMIVVLYTAQRGNWKTEGDMAVTLPPPSEQVFTRFFRLLDKDVIFCSNYPPSVPFHGSYRGHSGVISFMHEFAKHTVWTNFKIGGLSVDGSIAVASGKEELENKRDNRKFIQNWVHKFTFYTDGRLARFEINGDVVAASAVFKVPGAATTLKLPQEFNEVDAEHGLEGTLLVRVMQGHGLKMGTSQKRTVKDGNVALVLVHREKPLPKQETASTAASAASAASTVLSNISMPAALTRKFSINLLSTGTTSSDASEPKIDPYSTGPPKNNSSKSYSPMNPVWNKVIALPFEKVIGTCSLRIDVTDYVKSGTDMKIGFTSVNISKYIMSCDGTPKTEEQEESAMAADTRWYTISNAKGEYCGKVLLGITCRRSAPIDEDVNIAQPRLKKSQSVVIDHYNPPSSHMLQWEASVNPHLLGAATPAHHAAYIGQTPHSTRHDEFGNDYRRHGWANVKLSPEALNRTRSDGSIAQDAETTTVHKRFPGNSGRDAVECKENENMHTFMVCGAPFTIPKHYELIKVCGRGAYGIVIAATDTSTGGNVAIKKVIDCIWHPHQLKQILRETRLIRHMAHENILSLMDLIPPPSYTDFRDVYMTVDLMEMDLHRIIYSKEVLLDDHIRYFLYQILSGLSHMHKAGVLHRDLKPSNLLINSDCQLKICDLGLARSVELDDVGMTEYVVTRWYRAPELLLGSAYGDGVDLWAAGCIFAEMLGRKPLFPGETYVHQLQLIMNVLGVPEEHSFKENPLANKLKGRQLLSRTQAVAGIDVSTMFPNSNPEALDLLWKMLVFDVEKRISVEEALRHPYLAAYYDEERENRPVEKFQSFDLDGLDENDLKELMFKEICHFHPEEMEKRAKQQHDNPEDVEKLPSGWVKRESRSVPGKFYYSNPKRGISTWVKEEMETL